MFNTRLALVLVAALIAPAALRADTLKAGASAPTLSIEKWVKGKSFEKFEKGKIYVVEFWATWCGPCIVSIPHLNELQTKYAEKGVTIVGVTAKDPSNSLEKVEKFVKERGTEMGYTVAWDGERATYKSWMEAAKQRGIPTSFIVDKDSKIAWIGHPMMLDIPLAEVVAGTWDIEKGPKKLEEIQKRIRRALSGGLGDPEGTIKKLEALEKDIPVLAHQFRPMRFQLYIQAGKVEEASKLGKELVDEAIKQKAAQQLNLIAWSFVDPEAKLEKRDLALALRAAEKAVEITKSENAAILDTLARVWFFKGDREKALELQKKAVAIADAREKPLLEKTLEEYEGNSF